MIFVVLGERFVRCEVRAVFLLRRVFGVRTIEVTKKEGKEYLGKYVSQSMVQELKKPNEST